MIRLARLRRSEMIEASPILDFGPLNLKGDSWPKSPRLYFDLTIVKSVRFFLIFLAPTTPVEIQPVDRTDSESLRVNCDGGDHRGLPALILEIHFEGKTAREIVV